MTCVANIFEPLLVFVAALRFLDMLLMLEYKHLWSGKLFEFLKFSIHAAIKGSHTHQKIRLGKVYERKSVGSTYDGNIY